MKTSVIKAATALCAATLFIGFVGRVHADDASAPTTSQTKDRAFSGIIKSVDENERTVAVEGFWSVKTFNIGDHCAVRLEDKPSAILKDLRPGHHVDVEYLSKDGVKVANRISQTDSTFTGHISSVDPTKRTFTVKRGVNSKSFITADDCKVVIRDEKGRGLADLKIGHKVTVRYAATMQEYLAHKVEQSSLVFSGTVEAIDVTTGTVKAKQVLTSRKFQLGNECPIVIDGRANAKLSDLRIGDKLSFHYEDMDGVLVANRIARENSPQTLEPDRQLTRTE